MESGFKIPLPTGNVCVFSRLPVGFVSRPQLGERVHRPESETFENRSELPGGDSLPSQVIEFQPALKSYESQPFLYTYQVHKIKYFVFPKIPRILYCHLWLPLYKGFGAFEIPDQESGENEEKQNALFSKNERNQNILENNSLPCMK